LETALDFIVPNPPTKNHQLICICDAHSNGVVSIIQEEFDWLITFSNRLTEFSPLLFSSIGIKKETDQFVAKF
jgi:hypothetical protein